MKPLFTAFRLHTLKVALILIIIAYLFYYLLVHPDAIAASAISSINVCLTIIIPSLYAFMVLSCFLLETRLYTIISKPFSPIAKHLFKLDSDTFSIFIMSAIGGYPVGAKLLSTLVAQGKLKPQTAARMLCFCTASGPSYIIGVIAMQLYKSITIGIIIYSSIITANIILAVIMGLRVKMNGSTQASVQRERISIGSVELIAAVNASVKALLSICSLIVLFGVFLCVLKESGAVSAISHVLSSLLFVSVADCHAGILTFVEISNITQFPANKLTLLPLLTALSAFGGLCVTMQIGSIVKHTISMKRYLLTRPLVAILSAILCSLLTILLNPTAEALAKVPPVPVSSAISPISSVVLLLLTVLLLASLKNAERKK